MMIEDPSRRPRALEMLDELEISDLAGLRAIAHPIRLEMLERLARPLTVKDLAEQMDVPRTRLYRHLHTLLDASLIEIVETRQVRARVESVYRAVARSFAPGAALLTSGSMQEIGEAVLTTIFDTTRADMKRRLESGSLSLDQRDAQPLVVAIRRSTGFLDPDRAAAIVESLESLAGEVERDDDDAPSTDRLYTIQFAFYPSGRVSS